MDILLLPFDGSQNNSTPETASAEKTEKKVLPIIEQLAIINGRTSLYWTARAVAQSKRAERILVACNSSGRESLRPELPDDARFEFQDFSGNVEQIYDFQASLAGVIQRPTVVVACSRPLLHGKTLDALIDRAQRDNLDSAALVVNDTIARAAWGDDVPAPQRWRDEALHYLPLGIVGPQLLAGALRQNKEFAPVFERIGEKGGDNFKNLAPLTWKIVRTVGIGLPWKFMRRKATVQDVESVMAKVFGTRFAFVPCDDANLVLAVGEAKHRARIEKLLR